MLKRLALAASFALLACSAFADPIGQPQLGYQGPLTAGNCLKVLSSNGTAQDAGAPCGTGSGSGNVTGPASAVTGHLATYGDTTGKSIVDGGAVPVGAVGANPTGCVTGTVANGSATTFTRSDAAPPLCSSPAIPGSPTTTTQSASDNSTKVATTAYVTTGINNALAGINPAVAANAATTAAGDTSAWTYANGASGIGATFTGPTNTAITIDGFTFTATGQRLLVKNDTQSPSGAFNGLYTLTTLQTGITGAIFTRALDYDTPSDMNNTGSIPIVSGTANGTTSWVLTSSVATVGTSPLTFTQFTLNPANIAPLASPAFTGTPTAPTAAAGTSTTQLATTAYVQAAGINANSPIASRFSASTPGTAPIPITEATATRRGTSQGGLTYTVNENRAWSLYVNNGTGRTNSVIGWTIPCTSLAASCGALDVAFAASWVNGTPTSADITGFVIGFSDGTGVDAARSNLAATGQNWATFVSGPSATVPVVVHNSPLVFGGLSQIPVAYPAFFRVKDDGTNIFIYDSADGVNWHLWFEWAVASKVVSGAYNSVFIGCSNPNVDNGASWDQQEIIYLIDTAPSSRGSSLLRPY